MTRAKDRLFLSRAMERFWRGAARSLPPSRFLKGIAPELVAQHSLTARRRRPPQQYNLF